MPLIIYHLDTSRRIAASIRVGQLCGAKDVRAVKATTQAALLLIVCIATVCAIVFLVAGDVLAKAFTTDAAVVAQVAALAPIAALFALPDACQAVLGGIFRGLGRQRLVAWLNVMGFWVIGTPLGWALTFKAGLGVSGLWWGLNASLFSTCIFGACLMARVNWDEAVHKAAALSAVKMEGTPKPELKSSADEKGAAQPLCEVEV
jgi:MATE family multidrug resistance protein